MEMINVSSSNIAAIGYDVNRAILVIEFLNGYAYEYFDVPEYIFLEFQSADSKGKYAHANIYKHFRENRI